MLIQPGGFRVGQWGWRRLAVVDQPSVGPSLVNGRYDRCQIQWRVGIRLKERHGNRGQSFLELDGPYVNIGAPTDAAESDIVGSGRHGTFQRWPMASAQQVDFDDVRSTAKQFAPLAKSSHHIPGKSHSNGGTPTGRPTRIKNRANA